MKPDINLKSPFIQAATQRLNELAKRALNAPQTVESAVIPLYCIPPSKGHQKPKRKPEQFGSGVLMNIHENYFIFSATHIFLEYGLSEIITSGGDGTPTLHLKGERFSTGNINNPKKDILDASVYHIQTEIPDSLKRVAITIEKLDILESDKTIPIYIVSGFRIKQSNTSGNRVTSKRDGYPTIEFNQEDYKKYNIDPKKQILLCWEKQVLVSNVWQTTPTPRGMSGGAIIKMINTDAISLNNNSNITQSLAAIITEYHKGSSVETGRLIGTRINVHLGLIYKFMPNVFLRFCTCYPTNNYSIRNRTCLGCK